MHALHMMYFEEYWRIEETGTKSTIKYEKDEWQISPFFKAVEDIEENSELRYDYNGFDAGGKILAGGVQG